MLWGRISEQLLKCKASQTINSSVKLWKMNNSKLNRLQKRTRTYIYTCIFQQSFFALTFQIAQFISCEVAFFFFFNLGPIVVKIATSQNMCVAIQKMNAEKITVKVIGNLVNYLLYSTRKATAITTYIFVKSIDKSYSHISCFFFTSV